jgi:hypothetical protein
MHAQTKHFALYNHHVREKSEDGTVQVHFIPSDKQQADLFTKPLAPQQFLNNQSLIGLSPLPSSNPSNC